MQQQQQQQQQQQYLFAEQKCAQLFSLILIKGMLPEK